MTKSNLRRNVFVSSYSLQYIIQGSQGGNSRWEPGGRNSCGGLGAVLLNGLLSLLYYTTQHHCPGEIPPPAMDLSMTIINQEDVPKCLSIGQSCGGAFSQLSSPLPK